MFKMFVCFLIIFLMISGTKASEKRALRVIFYGDSITQYWNLESSFLGKEYINRGASGMTTTDMLASFEKMVLGDRPDVVVLLGGTNDVGRMTLPEIEQKTEANVRAMVEMANKHHARMIVGSVPPAADGAWGMGVGLAPKIKLLNEWLAAYCLENHIQFVDYFSAMADRKGNPKAGLLRDGVHPTAAGYEVMTPLAAAAIDAVVAQK